MKRFAEVYANTGSPAVGSIIDADGNEGKLQAGQHKSYHAGLTGSHFVAVVGTFREDDDPFTLFKQLNGSL